MIIKPQRIQDCYIYIICIRRMCVCVCVQKFDLCFLYIFCNAKPKLHKIVFSDAYKTTSQLNDYGTYDTDYVYNIQILHFFQ